MSREAQARERARARSRTHSLRPILNADQRHDVTWQRWRAHGNEDKALRGLLARVAASASWRMCTYQSVLLLTRIDLSTYRPIDLLTYVYLASLGLLRRNELSVERTRLRCRCDRSHAERQRLELQHLAHTCSWEHEDTARRSIHIRQRGSPSVNPVRPSVRQSMHRERERESEHDSGATHTSTRTHCRRT